MNAVTYHAKSPINSPSRHALWDMVGLFTSLLCMVHCLVLPMLVSVLPMLSTPWLHSEWVHLVLLLVVVPSAYIGLHRGYQKHKNKVILHSAQVAVVLLAAAGLWIEPSVSERAGHTMTILGSVLLLLCHAYNLSLLHKKSARLVPIKNHFGKRCRC